MEKLGLEVRGDQRAPGDRGDPEGPQANQGLRVRLAVMARLVH